MSTEKDLRRAVDERLAETIRQNQERRDGRRRRLAELAARRQAGLRARHRNKLARNQGDQQEGTTDAR